MSLILKSNVAYNGTKKLRSATVLSMSPQDYFNQYKARVEADGGVITDPVKTLATIEFLFQNELVSRTNALVSASFGVRKDASNDIDKLYSISGHDLVAKSYGAGVLPKFNAAEAMIDVVSTVSDNNNGTLFKTEKPVRVSAKGQIGFIVTAKMDKVDNAQPTFINYTDLGENADLYAMGRLIFSQSRAMAQNPLPNNIATTTSYVVATKQPVFHFWDVSRRTSKMYVNSVQAYAATMDLSPLIPTAFKYLTIGGSVLAAAKTFSHYDWYSAWALFDFTEAEGLLISDFLKTL
ncbi:hypothetical protein V5I80_05310 [Acinetobacter radioresistens]|uniref:hypothetical protein n=1 Tax=Acinetobacter radioresistens TaxID=40216 RepID=UPI002FCDD893